MNNIFNDIPLPALEPEFEYCCSNDSYLLKYTADKSTFDAFCKALADGGFTLFQKNDIDGNEHCTFAKNKTVHTYFCPCDNSLRVVAEPALPDFCTAQTAVSGNAKTTLWQFEVDHSLIDCGMCYIIRCRDNSFFVIDSAHMYSVNDDIRICEFLRKMSGESKPRVCGWFFSHAHEDHIDKFLDILRYHKAELSIEHIYYNFPPSSHRDSSAWDYASKSRIDVFEDEIKRHKDIKITRLHTGQKFFVSNLAFTVLVTHEDIYPMPICDFNNSSAALMMEAEGTRVFFPGDSAGESSKVLEARYDTFLACDILQVSHHGHFGLSPRLYEKVNAPCALFPITTIKFDEEYEKQPANKVVTALSKEWYVASNGTVQIDLPYVYGNTVVFPDETKEDWDGVYNLWNYSYTDEVKEKSFWNKDRIWK